MSTNHPRTSILAFCAITLLSTCLTISAHAGIVTTQEMLDAQQLAAQRTRLDELLARAEVQTALMARGVAVEAARDRVASLSDSEIQTLAVQMDQLPAGGKLSTLEIVLLVIIIILII